MNSLIAMMVLVVELYVIHICLRNKEQFILKRHVVQCDVLWGIYVIIHGIFLIQSSILNFIHISIHNLL